MKELLFLGNHEHWDLILFDMFIESRYLHIYILKFPTQVSQ